MPEAAAPRERFCPYRGKLGMRSSGHASLPPALTEPLARRFKWALGVAALLWLGFLALSVAFAPAWLTAAGSVAAVGSVALIAIACRGVATTKNLGQLGSTLGAYELEAPIAQGGMGEVWRAKHQLLRRPAAIKLIKPQANGSGELEVDKVSIRRFEREAQVTASLHSPHTVQLYDFGVTQTGTFYYVMELLEGTDLETLVQERGPLEPVRVVRVLEQALDSLAEAHSHGLVHRDIKPANLHLSERGLEKNFVKVLDFGLVKLGPNHPVDDPQNRSLSRADRITGTPAYLAPELITGQGKVDGRADIYALGCVAYYLLTGKLVFEGGSAMQMAVAHAVEAPIPPSQRVSNPIPKALERIVMACLEKDPEHRPGSAIALLQMLRGLDLGDDSRSEASLRRPKQGEQGNHGAHRSLRQVAL
jgi:serine/threonine protein kinase